MKISALQETLASAISTVSRAVSSRTTIPVLSGILLSAAGGELQLTATDQEIGISLAVPITVHEPGAVVLPAKYFGEIIRRLPGGEVDIDVKGSVATISWQRSQFTINGFPADEFPLLPEDNSGMTLEIDQTQMRNLIRQTIYCTARDEIRPTFTGVLFKATPTTLELVATDGARLAYSRAAATAPEGQAFQTIVPGRTLGELTRILTGDAKPIKVGFSGNQIHFTANGCHITSRLIEGQFPNYEMAIPKDYKTVLKVSNREFSEALDRASLIAAENSYMITLAVEEDRLILTCNTPDVGNVHEEVLVEKDGDRLQIGFNARLLIDALRSIEYDEVLLELTGPLSPARIRPQAIDSTFAIVLPMRIM
ncbi:MAG: DNA polymerase III subunit beta [Chloroflexota bacterium]